MWVGLVGGVYGGCAILQHKVPQNDKVPAGWECDFRHKVLGMTGFQLTKKKPAALRTTGFFIFQIMENRISDLFCV